ncbi:MAG: alpha/beta hydrolase [Nocardioidaceae bacterium]|nr:alpha/beta hydrolase [Nocardioidaceae bacterium]
MTRSSEPPDAVLRYADHDDGVVDVHLPSTPGPHPLVVHLHGGFWRQRFDRTHARPLAEALVADGYVVALPEYRRGPGAWRETLDDLTAVMTRLPELLEGLGVRTTGTTLSGHSAGGHLVLWLASEGYDVRRVVALAPAADLRTAAAWGMGSGAAVEFLGGTPDDVPDAYAAADPGTRLATRPATDVLVVHGTADDRVPVDASRELTARYPWIDYRELPGVDHFDVIDPLSGAWPTVRESIGG